MKKNLIYLLLLSYLCVSNAFAWDTHPEALVGHDIFAVNALSEDSSPALQDSHQADHCCHASEHMTGLAYASAVMPVACTRHSHLFITQKPYLAYCVPLYRPPIR